MLLNHRVAQTLFGIASLLWLAMFGALTTRLNFLLDYQSLPTLPPLWEPIGSPLAALALAILFLVSLYCFCQNNSPKSALVPASLCLLAAAVPLLFVSILRQGAMLPRSFQNPHVLELMWFSTWSGLSMFRCDIEPIAKRYFRSTWSYITILTVAVIAVTWFWTQQAWQYHQDFRLGFNDFGHFTWRLANTWNGRGWLLESPTLPIFWDHFNPGIVLIAPLWGWTKTPLAIFALHGLSLSLNAYLIFAITRKLGGTIQAALIWSLVWLAHPSIGMWNLAFTYHWHPVTLGLPFFLASFLAVTTRRYLAASVLFALAAAMEEGWLVVGALSALSVFAVGMPRPVLSSIAAPNSTNADSATFSTQIRVELRRAFADRWGWLIAGCVISIIFVAVYRYSGLAEFQTARFAKLGNSASEILLSPLVRPSVFFGQVLQLRNLMFVLGLVMPLGIVAIARGWSGLLPTILPLAVLVAWDHQPAACLAFHYATTLMPIFFIAALQGAARFDGAQITRYGMVALATCVITSSFWGGLPWSPSSTLEAEGQSYGIDGIELRRETSDDGRWLHRQIQKLQPHAERSVLATGRIAGHFLEGKFLDTAGQFRERRERLMQLSPSGSEWDWFDTIVLDHQENFQQSSDWSRQLQQEALTVGFRIEAESHGITILVRDRK